MKKNWIIIIVIFLLTANAALTLTLILKKNVETKEVVQNNKSTKHKFKKRMGGFEKHLVETLDLSEQQKTQLKELSREFHITKHQYYDNLAEMKQKYFRKIITEYSDTELKQIADSLGKIHVEMMLLDHKHYSNIRSICTEKQVQIFDSLGTKHITNRKFNRFGQEHGRRHHEPRQTNK